MAAVQTLEKGLLVEMLRRMLRIRRFEEQVVRLVERGEIVGATHSYIGGSRRRGGLSRSARGRLYDRQPPLARPSYRQGGQVQKAMAELFGKRTGLCKGKGAPCTWRILASASWGSQASWDHPSLRRWVPPWAASCKAMTGWPSPFWRRC